MDSTIRYLEHMFRNRIRNREVACSYTLETKLLTLMLKGEKKQKQIDIEMFQQGGYPEWPSISYYRYIIDLI